MVQTEFSEGALLRADEMKVYQTSCVMKRKISQLIHFVCIRGIHVNIADLAVMKLPAQASSTIKRLTRIMYFTNIGSTYLNKKNLKMVR
jgi:hypothetical protein